MLTTEDAADALEASREHPVVIYKHSPWCDLSARAMSEMDAFRERNPGTDVRIVDVIAARPASQWIEVRTGIRHESPQVLVATGGVVRWSASHRNVRADALADALA